MDNDQRANSRDTLERLFWAGVESSRQPPAKDAPAETAAISAAQASLWPPQADREDVQPAETAGQDAPVAESSRAAPHEPNAGSTEPAPAQAQELASVDSPAVQPALMDANAAHPLPAEPQVADTEASFYAKKRSEITALMDTLRGSVDNVEEHGRRAESILKNMLLHLRESSAANQAVNINALGGERLRA